MATLTMVSQKDSNSTTPLERRVTMSFNPMQKSGHTELMCVIHARTFSFVMSPGSISGSVASTRLETGSLEGSLLVGSTL